MKEELTKEENELIDRHEAIRFSASKLCPGSPAESFSEFVHDFLNQENIYYDTETCLWWHWDKKEYKWKITNETEILRLFLYVYAVFNWIEPKIKNKIIEVLKVMACIKPKPLPTSWIQFKNKVIDIKTKEEFKATYDYFYTNPIPFNISDSDETPETDKLFSQWMDEKKQLLYEIIAYCMYRAYPIPKIFMLFGKGRNGKSQYIKLLNRIIGESNVVATSINLLSESMRFTTLRLMNKSLIQLTELEANKEFPLAELKKLTGGDLISFEVKRGGDGQFRNFGKVIMATNNMPKIQEDSDAVAERFFLIDFVHKFDPTPHDIIDNISDEEISNLCRKCINMLPDIIESGKFSFEGSIEEKKAAVQSKQHVISKFFDEYTMQDPCSEVLLSDLMAALKNFCDKRNISSPDESYIRWFIRSEYKNIYDIKRKKNKNGDNIWVIDGILLTFLTFLSPSQLISRIGNQVEIGEKVEKVENFSTNEVEKQAAGCSSSSAADSLLDKLFDLNIELSYIYIKNRCPENIDLDKTIEKFCTDGKIIQTRPGYYKKL